MNGELVESQTPTPVPKDDEQAKTERQTRTHEMPPRISE